VTPGRTPARHLRPRGDGVEQPITTIELFFDLVYVFAVTQLSHMIPGDLTVAEVGRAAFLRTPARLGLGTRLGFPTDAPGVLLGDPRHLQQQREGTS
jgi:hypothetical protein